jgi:thioredoxin 1
MTNGLGIPFVPCCPQSGGGDLMPLLIVVVVLLAGHIAIQEFKKRKGKTEMKNLGNIAIVVAVLVAAGIVFALKQDQTRPADPAPAPAATAVQSPADSAAPTQSAALPRMVDLGADKCIPCKMMAPILEEMKTAYAGQIQVEFIDVWKHPDAGEQYGIRSIPTQIFYDANGKELFRHEGFFPKEDMLSKWKELGVELVAPAAKTP